VSESKSIPTTPWWRNDAVIFAALVAVAAIAFAATYGITRSYQRRQDALARRWYQRGQADLDTGNAKAAVGDFRTALLFAPDRQEYRLRLAQALAADNDIPQAIAYFLNLWEQQPGSGPINLELARLYARDRQSRQAAHYFNNAIYGIWPDDAVARRRQARIEYIKFLLSQQQTTQAQAEAISLAGAIPPGDEDGELQAADLLFATGDFDHALTAYDSLLTVDPARAGVGAAKAAFQLGYFRTAAERLRTAIEHGADDPAAKNMLSRAETVLGLDPSQRHLSNAERAKRVSTAYVQAGTRLQECADQKQIELKAIPPTSDLQLLYSDWSRNSSQLSQLARDPDTRDFIMDLAFRIEAATTAECGPSASANDWALQMLSRYGEGVER